MSIRWTRALRAAALERFGEQHELLAAAAAELDDRALGLAERRDDRRRRAARAARVSARVMRYHGSRQIASNRLEPSAS